MRATVLYGAGDVRIENVPDARLSEPTDALVTVSRACICGSDLWPYKLMKPGEPPRRMGHEAIGVVEAVGSGVRTLKVGDVVVMPFAYSDGTCVFCHEGLHTSCIGGGFFGTVEIPGAQAEAVRVPLADGTLVVLPVGADDALMPSLLTLSDVMGTGHHAARAAASASARLVTSSLTTSRSFESPTALATASVSRPVATTAWPAARAALAKSTPMPRAAPVMNQIFLLATVPRSLLDVIHIVYPGCLYSFAEVSTMSGL